MSTVVLMAAIILPYLWLRYDAYRKEVVGYFEDSHFSIDSIMSQRIT